MILLEPPVYQRPPAYLRYKIEDQEYFCMERQTYIDIRDYILMLEGSVEFCVREIRASNNLQREIGK